MIDHTNRDRKRENCSEQFSDNKKKEKSKAQIGSRAIGQDKEKN